MVGDTGKAAFGLGRPEYLNRMHEQLEELVADRARMGELLQVAIEIGSDLDLDSTLSRIVNAAMTMTGARYGAVGVWAPDGLLASFVHAGMDPDTVRLVGHLPAGKGLLGMLRERHEPLRLTDLTEHPAAVGFPGHHPRMRAFLGMPVIIRGAVFGSLYVTDDRPGRVFSEADEITLEALASAASVAIDNARLFDRVRTAERWTSASREVTTALLSEADPDLQPLQLICERAAELTGAEQAIVLVPADPEQPTDDVDTLVVSVAVGRYSNEALGQRVPVMGSTAGEVFRSGEPVITPAVRCAVAAVADMGERSAIVLPLRAEQQTTGVIVLARNAAAPQFEPEYLHVVRDFADHAAIALTLATTRRYARELSLLTDRERIAADLHDLVIQRVFSVGLGLQSVAARLRSPELAARMNGFVNELQDVISDIRTTIFDLRRPPAPRRDFAQSVQDAIARLTDGGDIVTSVRMSGPMGAVSGDLAERAEAFLAEALGDAVHHSGAGHVTVAVGVGEEISIEVGDDGPVRADDRRRSALVDLARRAGETGGRCDVASPAAGGTRVSWSETLSPRVR